MCRCVIPPLSLSPLVSLITCLFFSRVPHVREFPPLVCPAFADNSTWKEHAQHHFKYLLSLPSGPADAIAAVERSCRAAARDVSLAEWHLPASDHELNLYFAQVAYQRQLRGCLGDARQIVSRAPHWQMARLTGHALLTRLSELIDKLRGRVLLLRDRSLQAAVSRPSGQRRLVQTRMRWQSLWALWRSHTHISPPSRFLIGGGESQEPRDITDGLADYWGQVAAPLHVDDAGLEERSALLRQISEHFVHITWPSRPFACAADFKARLKHTCAGPDGVRYAHLRGLGERRAPP